MQKIGWFGRSGALNVMGNATIRQSAYDFLFDFNRNYMSILYRFRDIACYFSKVADFDPRHLHQALSQGMTPIEFRGDLWRQKTRVPGLSCGVVCVVLCLAVLVELRLVTDRRTDTDTDGHRPMASTADAQHREVRNSATADGPRDALCQSKSCKLLHNCRKKLYNKSSANQSNVEICSVQLYCRRTCR